MTNVDALLDRYRRRCDALLDSHQTDTLSILVHQYDAWERTGNALWLDAALTALDRLEAKGEL